jgi:Coenzyme PQQ synthesis protein D (PqqD)
MTEITDDMVFVPAQGLEVSEVPDGRVIYQPAREKVHYMNPTAVVVFEFCDMKRPVGEIVAFLKMAYQLPNLPAAEVRECIASLLKEDLLRPLNQSSPAP